jgi:hypothetical protein
MSISNFLSISANLEVALESAREALNDRKKTSVLMEITVNENTPVFIYNTIASTLHHLWSFIQAVDTDIQALPPYHPQNQIHMQNLEILKQELTSIETLYLFFPLLCLV